MTIRPLMREVARTDPHTVTQAQLRSLYLKVRRYEARTLSDEALKSLLMRRITGYAEERTYGTVDLRDARATDRIEGRKR